MTFMHRRLFIAIFFAYALVFVAHAQDGPKNSVVLIIRHAEDADSGDGISPLGQERAGAYKNYFREFTLIFKRLEPEAIFAAKDSKQSHRPRLTVEPFAKATKLPIDTRFGNSQSVELAADLRANHQGKWFSSAGVTDNTGSDACARRKARRLSAEWYWPGSVSNWVILLSYDQDGRLIPSSSKRIDEHLISGDSQ